MAERCFVGCTPGLEAALKDELEGLGVRAEVTNGGCEVTGPDGSVVRLNVQSRLASRVLLRLGTARTPAALAGLPVRALVGELQVTLSVTTAGRVSPPAEVWRREAMRALQVGASPGSPRPPGAKERVARGPVSPPDAGAAPETASGRLGREGDVSASRGGPRRETGVSGGPRVAGLGSTPSSEMATPADEGLPAGSDDAVELSLRLDAQGALVSVDTSGELLHVRGARQETGKAPLRETLASGVLRLCEWAPGEPLWDIMCGSGTFLLEAAEQAQGLQPGRQRHFAFERFPGVPAHLLAEARAPRPAVPTWLRGSDLNAGALGVARRNARRAGIGEPLQLERLDATALTRPDVAPGLVLANLPYGKRVGSRFELASLYARVGRSLKQALPGWRFGFLLQDGAESLGLDVARTVPVKNGGLSCLVVTGRV
jgi:putative N6-adenine-specific DNA methylase